MTLVLKNMDSKSTQTKNKDDDGPAVNLGDAIASGQLDRYMEGA